MTKFERSLFRKSCALGVALTVAVAALAEVGPLRSLELYLDDVRTRNFQYFMPKPSDQVMYVDIDDGALDVIGRWPWPRWKLALMLDEMYTAGAKVVDFDVVLSEAEGLTYVPGQPPVDSDALFAKSIGQFRSTPGRGVILPLSININLQDSQDPEYLTVVRLLRGDLEMSDDDVTAHLKAAGFSDPQQLAKVVTLIPSARDDAMFHRIKAELDKGRPPDAEALRAVLLPQSEASGQVTESVRALRTVLPRVESYEAILGFTRPLQEGLPPLLSRDVEQDMPVASLARASGLTGFVDFWLSENSKIRTIPLWVLDRGRMVPQMALAMACAELGVNPKDLELSADRVTINCPDGRKINIPVFTRRANGRTAGMLMDIPWFGGEDWQTMYDWPSHQKPTRHMPITKVWDICDIDPAIEENNRQLLEAVYNAYAVSSPEDAQRVRDHPAPFNDAAAWNKIAHDTLESLGSDTVDYYKQLLTGSGGVDSIKDPKDREMVLAIKDLGLRPAINDELVAQRAGLRADLHTRLNGKAVLIGEVATAGGDLQATPLAQVCPGVVVHGVVANAILDNLFLYRAPAWVSVALTLVVGVLVTLVSAYFQGLTAALLSGGIAAVFLLMDFFLAYDWGKTEIDAAGPITAAVVICAVCTLYHFIVEKKQRAMITSRFSSYVDPSLVNYVLEHPEKKTLKGERRELSVVFTDLAGFTKISEMLKEETVGLLNEYLGRMVPVISGHHGLVNKFLGDGIMFFFGAPEPYPGDATLHAWAAVQTVVEMQQAMITFNEELVRRNLPSLKMRAGISTGEMMVGDAGNPPQRSDYTVLGDRVNLASRLESANKYTGTLTLISDRTYELLGDTFLVRPIGRLQVVGKNEWVMTYEPLAPMEKATDEMRRLVEISTVMTDAYVHARFTQCVQAAQKLEEAFGAETHGKLCDLYRGLCAEYLKTPPTDFVGQIKLESK